MAKQAAEMANLAPEGARRVRTRPRQDGGSAVNRTLTPRVQRETPDVAAGVGRMLRGLSRRAEGGDLQALVALEELARQLAGEQLRAAHALNVQHAYSWREIGLALGVTRQAVHRRWGQS